MKRIKKILLLLLAIGLTIACLSFLFINVNRGIVIPEPEPMNPIDVVDVQAQEKLIAARLREAPWQGLRFLPEHKEWRFYAVAGEQRKINLIAPFDLIKVYFLQADGVLSYTWAATGVDIPGEGYYAVAVSPLQAGDLLEVAVSGAYVTQFGVYWEDCDTEFCHLAQMIDTTLILDDKGTGLTNGFSRYGWEPPSYPMYGFLCWQIRPYTVNWVAEQAGGLQ